MSETIFIIYFITRLLLYTLQHHVKLLVGVFS